MRYVVGTAIVGLLVGLALRYVGGHHVVGWAMVGTMVVLPLAGVLITVDDDLPGGFSNPDGSAPGPWRDWENWADLAARAAITGIGFSIDRNVITVGGAIFLLVGIAGMIASVKVQRRINAKTALLMANNSLQRP